MSERCGIFLHLNFFRCNIEKRRSIYSEEIVWRIVLSDVIMTFVGGVLHKCLVLDLQHNTNPIYIFSDWSWGGGACFL